MSTSLGIRISKSQIPNIYGTFSWAGGWCITGGGEYGYGSVPTGMFYNADAVEHYAGIHNGNSTARGKIGLSASYINPRYGSYTEVNPLYEGCIFCISY